MKGRLPWLEVADYPRAILDLLAPLFVIGCVRIAAERRVSPALGLILLLVGFNYAFFGLLSPTSWGHNYLDFLPYVAIVAAIVLEKTIFGVRLRAVGLNPVAATRAGISYGRIVITALALAGALGGLAGAFMIQGEQYLLKDGFSSGYGFDGLVAGLLARGSVGGVIAASLLFGFLRSGGINMEMVAAVPTALVMVIQGLIVIMLAGASFWLDRRVP